MKPNFEKKMIKVEIKKADALLTLEKGSPLHSAFVFQCE
jgi:hypothetical protein